MGRSLYNAWPRYVPVAERRRKAAKKVAALKKNGREIVPIEVSGRTIASTFWGKAWCDNLEAYSDYANRLPRGRTYVRNGSVVDLHIESGRVVALVNGSELYSVEIAIKGLSKPRWTEIKERCAGQIDSLVELLQGAFSRSVMEVIARKGEGLFPVPAEINLKCSCPDWATMCKHVAAALYGVGARLDDRPDLLFALRGVDPAEMIEAAVQQPMRNSKGAAGRVLATDTLSSVFGVDIDLGDDEPPTPATATTSSKPKGAARSPASARSAIAGQASAGKARTGKAPAGAAGESAATETAKTRAARTRRAASQPAAQKSGTPATTSAASKAVEAASASPEKPTGRRAVKPKTSTRSSLRTTSVPAQPIPTQRKPTQRKPARSGPAKSASAKPAPAEKPAAETKRSGQRIVPPASAKRRPAPRTSTRRTKG